MLLLILLSKQKAKHILKQINEFWAYPNMLPGEYAFAFLLPKTVKANDIVKKIKKIDKKIINKVSIFDVYEGEKIESNSKSIAIRILLQPLVKTFSDEEIESISNKIIDTVITSFTASLRK